MVLLGSMFHVCMKQMNFVIILGRPSQETALYIFINISIFKKTQADAFGVPNISDEGVTHTHTHTHPVGSSV